MPQFEFNKKLLFLEIQRFQEYWFWILLFSSMIIETAIFGPAMYQQLSLGKPWGNHPFSDADLIVFVGIVVLVTALILFFFSKARLITEVRMDGLFIRFHPFHSTYLRIPLENVLNIQAVTYRPLLDYGGWGIRIGWKKKAYNVSGNRGVMIQLNNGKSILIGSQKPDDLVQAIRLIQQPIENPVTT